MGKLDIPKNSPYTNIRDTPNINSSLNSKVRNIIFGEDSLDIILVNPAERGHYSTGYIFYDRIREHLVYSTLKEVLKARFKPYALAKIKYSDRGEFFTYQYDDYPILFIMKDDGKIYSPRHNSLAQMEAFRLLRVLVKFGLVQGYQRKTLEA